LLYQQVVQRPSLRTMARLAVLTTLLSSAAAIKELTPKDFDKEVFNSGKGAFIKFLAPW